MPVGLASAASVTAPIWGPLAYFAGKAAYEDKKAKMEQKIKHFSDVKNDVKSEFSSFRNQVKGTSGN